MGVRKSSSQLRSRRRAKVVVVAFGVVMAIALGLLSVVNSSLELKGKGYHVTRYLQALDPRAPAEATEIESQSTMPPANTSSTTPAEAEQGRSTTAPAELDNESPAFNNVNDSEVTSEEAEEEVVQSSRSAASSADKHAQSAEGSAEMSDTVQVGDMDTRGQNGEQAFSLEEIEGSDSDDSDSDDSDSDECNSDDSDDSGSDDSDDSGSDDSDDSGSEDSDSDSVSVSCNESRRIMNRW